MKILDLGCGNGKYRSKNSKDIVIGVDKNKNSQADVIHDLEITPYPFRNNEFDMICASHALEHLSNPMKAFEEIRRVGKVGAKILVRAPHFSSSWAYGFEHKRYFSIMGFKKLEGFEIKKIRLNWLMRAKSYAGNYNIVLRTLDRILNFLANKKLHFCERFWCYYVGGFSEIEVEMIRK